jgi:tRNA nucleotidyltransferase (CCA-adding enzyme)
VVDHAVALAVAKGLNDEDRLVVVFGALCHDFGKVSTTELENGRWTSKGHAADGEEPTRSFLERLGAPKKFHDRVVALVREHMVQWDVHTPRTVRRLLLRLNGCSIHHLLLVCEADSLGRGSRSELLRSEFVSNILELVNEVENQVVPLLLGRHVLAFGVAPGPFVGEVLKDAFEAQLEGEFLTLEDGLLFLQRRLGN